MVHGRSFPYTSHDAQGNFINNPYCTRTGHATCAPLNNFGTTETFMRHILTLPLFMLFLPAMSQVQLRAYHHLLTSAGPTMDRCTPLANGDIAYYDQVQPTLARLGSDGSVLWVREFDGEPGIADVVEMADGRLLALLHMPIAPGAPAQSYPVIVGMSSSGAVLWSKRWTGAMGFAMTVQAYLAPRPNDGFFLVYKPLAMGGGNETLHAFDGDGNLQWAKLYEEPGALPARMAMLPDGGFHGSNELYLTRYDDEGGLLWAMGPMLIGGTFAAIRDVGHLPNGELAFAFATNTTGSGCGVFCKPGIGIITDPDEPVQTCIFDAPGTSNADPNYLNLEMAVTASHILLIAPNGTSGGTQPSYVLRADHDLASGQAYVADLGTGGYVRTLRPTSDGGAALTGRLVSTGIGQKLVGRIAPTAQLGGCFAPVNVPFIPIAQSISTLFSATSSDHAPLWSPFAVETMDRSLTMQAWCLYTDVPEVAAMAQPPLVYPNPAQDAFTVEWPSATAAHMRLVDIEGRVCHEALLTAPMGRIHTTGMAPGTYLLQLKHLDGSGSATMRVVLMP